MPYGIIYYIITITLIYSFQSSTLQRRSGGIRNNLLLISNKVFKYIISWHVELEKCVTCCYFYVQLLFIVIFELIVKIILLHIIYRNSYYQINLVVYHYCYYCTSLIKIDYFYYHRRIWSQGFRVPQDMSAGKFRRAGMRFGWHNLS